MSNTSKIDTCLVLIKKNITVKILIEIFIKLDLLLYLVE